MRGSRAAPTRFGLLVVFVLGACAATPVIPSATSGDGGVAASSSPAAFIQSPAASAAYEPTSSAPLADGEIVFEDAGQDFKNTHIWVENADGSDVRQLTDDATDNSASVSPDGGTVVFYRWFTDSPEAAVADPTLFGAVMTVNIDGSDLRELDTGNRVNRCDAAPEGDAWSPDGLRIAYTRVCFDRSAQPAIAGVWTINADGSDAREVTRNLPGTHLEDHRAGWSPDGKSLVFQRIDTAVTPERSAIFTVGIDGGDVRQVTRWAVDGNDPDWSPDGTAIAFNASAEPSATQNIYTIRPDGTGLAQLTTYDEAGQATFHPSWSPDGTQILFSHSPSTDGWGDLFIMDRDGGHQHVIAKTAMHENHGYWGSAPRN